MKISKDLADAVMMVACIVLVLIGTTTFESASTKAILMTVMAVLAVFMGAVRFLGREKNRHTNPLDKVQLLLFRRDAGIICRLFFCLFLNLL